jgi:hypothetical protein
LPDWWTVSQLPKKEMLPILSSYFFSGNIGGAPIKTYTVTRYWFEFDPKKKLCLDLTPM